MLELPDLFAGREPEGEDSPEGIARDATSRLPDGEATAAVKIDADSTLDFSVWAMGSSMEADTNLPGISSVACQAPKASV